MSYIQPVINAFLKGKPKKITNTETDGNNLYLFGNCIAKKGTDGIFISNGGYVDKKGHICSATTRDRLSLLGARIQQVNHKIYLNEKLWNGEWIKLGNSPEEKPEEQNKQLFS